MTAQEEISIVEAELDDARHALQETLTEVSAKAEHQEGALRPDRLIKNHPIGASCLAGALGFVIGSRAHVGPVLMAALLSYAISTQFSTNGSSGDGRDTSS
jgi:hypothetical protein